MESELPIVRTKKSLIPPGLQIAEDGAGLLFFSRETDDMFVLSALLKGFKKERIKVNKSKNKPQVLISGDKPVQEKLGLRWTVPRKNERASFTKVFWIPDGVNKLKAKFNEKENILSIFMTKSNSGIQGVAIKEVKEGVVEAETSETVRTTPVIAAEAPQTFEPKLKQPEITRSQDVVAETTSKLPEDALGKISTQAPTKATADPEREVIEPTKAHPEEIQHEQPSALPEGITGADSTQASSKTTINTEVEASKAMKSQQEEIQQEQPAAPEDITEADSTHGPSKTTTDPEKDVIEPIEAQPKEIQHEQTSVVPEDITEVESTQIVANEPMKAHAEEIQHEKPSVSPDSIIKADSTQVPAKTIAHVKRETVEPIKAHPEDIQREQPFALTEDISEEENIVQDQQVKEPWKGECEQDVQLKPQDDQPINEMQNEDLHREEYADEKEEEITVPAERSQKQSETLEDGSTRTEELRGEDQMNNEQTKDQELQREEIHETQAGIQEQQEFDQLNIPGEVEKEEEKGFDRDGKSLLCNSYIFAGSAFIGILIVFVVQLMRKDNNSKK